MTLNRETFLAPLTVKRELVELPEMGDGASVWVYGLTAREKNELEASMMNSAWTGINRKKATQQKERTLVRCLRNEDGSRLLQPDDYAALGEWPAQIIERLYAVANRLNGGTAVNETAAKNLEAIDDD